MASFRGVLVTGGAGFIGSHVVDALLRRGERVTILDNLSPKIHPGSQPPSYLQRDARLVVGDVRRAEDWLAALDGCDAVVHLAAYQDYNLDFSTFFAVNTVSTALLFELILAHKLPIARVVVASSQAVYGEGLYRCSAHGVVTAEARGAARLDAGLWECVCPVCGVEVTPELAPESFQHPANQYGLSKLDQESIALILGRLHGIDAAALRYSIVQGARQSPHNTYSGALRSFVIQALSGRSPVVFEDGRQLRDYVNIADAVDATLIALTHPAAAGHMFNVGSGHRTTVLDLAGAVLEAVGTSVGVDMPGMYRVGDTRHIVSDIVRLEGLGWKPTRLLQASVREYVEWFDAHGGKVSSFGSALDRMLQSGVVRRVRHVG